MGLRLKFNLVILFTYMIGICSVGYFGNQILLTNTKQEVLQNARILMDSALAIRDYTVNEIRPLINKAKHTTFIPQTVPAYAAHANFKRLRVKHKDYSYKEATINPTNPESRAADWEREIIDHFRENKDAKEFFGTHIASTTNLPFLYLSKPIKITNPKCLACHSTPKIAPQTLIDKYGNNNGFGWKLNSIVGAQIISVPMALAQARADVAFKSFMIMITIVFFVIWILMNLLLHFIIIKPVRHISDTANKISTGSIEHAKDIDITGNDEIASLAHSFNRMQRSLTNAVRMLDQG